MYLRSVFAALALANFSCEAYLGSVVPASELFPDSGVALVPRNASENLEPTPSLGPGRNQGIEQPTDSEKDTPVSKGAQEAGPLRQVPPANAISYADAKLYASGCPEGGGTGMATVQDMIDYVNEKRRAYVSHPQFSGYPWASVAVDPPTWSTLLSPHNELMERAQIFAAQVARGSEPLGKEFEFQNAVLAPKYDSESIWLHGLETAEYRLSALSKIGLVTGPETKGVMKWHEPYNGTLRMALFYQSGMPPFPYKRHIGVGRACMTNGDVWWVILVAEY